MSTIASLAIKIAGDASGFIEHGQRAVQMAEKISTGIVKNNVVVKSATAAWKAADSALAGYLGKAAKVGAAAGAIALLGKSLKNALSAESTGEIATSLKLVKDAMSSASGAFAKSFSSWSHLKEASQGVANAIERLAPLFQFAGATLGFIVRPALIILPVFVGLSAALKVLSVVLGLIVHTLMVRWIVQLATWRLLGTAMTPLTLAWAAAQKLLAAATWLTVTAHSALVAVGLPVWGSIAVVIGTVVAAVALVAAGAYAVYRAWKALTADDPAKKHAASLKEVQKAGDAATQSAFDFVAAVEEGNLTAGFTEAGKKVYELSKLINKAKEDLAGKGIEFDGTALEQQLRSALAIGEAARKRKEVTKTLKDLEEELATTGLDSVQKLAREMEKLGASAKDRQMAITLAEQIQSREQITKQIEEARTAEQRLKETGADLVADLQRRVDLFGQSAEMARIAEAAAKGVSSADIQAATALAKKLEALEEEKKKREEIAKIAIDAQKHMQTEAQQIIESVMTPLEKMQKKIDELKKLHGAGLINNDVFDRAKKAAEKEADKDKKKHDMAGEQGAAVMKGSQKDLALRYGPQKGLDREQLQEAKKANILLAKIAGQPAPGQPRTVNLN